MGSKLCYIVGADGGIAPRPVAMPSYGLMTDVAYRWWDAVCSMQSLQRAKLTTKSPGPSPKSLVLHGAVPVPVRGALTGTVLWRRDIVCNFTGYDAGRSLYLYNQPDPARTTSETPFFCYSHLVMKINISGKGAPPAVQPKLSFGPDEGVLETNVALNSTYLQVRVLKLFDLPVVAPSAAGHSLPIGVQPSAKMSAYLACHVMQ